MEVSRIAVPGASVEYAVAAPTIAPSARASTAARHTILFAHNLLTDRSVFDHAFHELSSVARVIAIDFRAHGDSRATRDFTISDLVNDLVAVLDAERVAAATIVGISLGAWCGVELALARPDRVKGLVLLGATPFSAKASDARESELLGFVARCLGVRAFMLKAVLPLLFSSTFQTQHPEWFAGWRTKLLAFGGVNLSRALRCWRTRPSVLDRLGEVNARTLVVVGEEDTAHPPAHGLELVKRIPGARLERLQAGHTVTVENPEGVGRLLDRFLHE